MSILNHKRFTLIFLLAVLMFSTASAEGMIDASSPKKLITGGLRVGINHSCTGINYDKIFSDVRNLDNDWKTGFDIGMVINLNITKFLSFQPGIYFQNRSSDSSMSAGNDNGDMSIINRHSRFYYFTLPVLASMKFQLGNGFELMAEIGPYFSWGVGGNTVINEMSTIVGDNGTMGVNIQKGKYDFFGDGTIKNVQMKTFDWGFKIGTGVRFMQRYLIMFHYNAGCTNIANTNDYYMKEPTARNKSWTLSLGYDF